MREAQKLLLKKYLIATLGSTAAFCLISYFFPGSRNVMPTARYLPLVILNSLVLFMTYFKWFKGYKVRKGWERGGTLYVVIMYFLGMIFCTDFATKIVDEATQHAEVVNSPELINEQTAEYIRLNHPTADTGRFTFRTHHWTSSRRGDGDPTHHFDYRALVPLLNNNGDSSVHACVKIEYTEEKKSALNEQQIKDHMDTFAEKSEKRTTLENLDSIVYFSREISTWGEISLHDTLSTRPVYILKPHYTTLESEASGDLMSFGIFYVVIFAMYGVFVLTIDSHKPNLPANAA